MRKWFWEHFLPMWAKETLLQDNRLLRRDIRRLQQENEVLLSYIRGLERGMRVRHRGNRRTMETPPSPLCGDTSP